MAIPVLPDSSFYIRNARLGLDPFQELSRHTGEWDFFACGMVITEVTRGLRDPRVLHEYQTSFALMTYIDTTAVVWERTAHLAWSLDRQGLVIPASDILIAACALETEAIVLTFDAHFQKIPGLRITSQLS
ncbi:MAG: VapC toxin family domain ribonuclease [Rariglobus sp.]|jgi:predicted nucleic acid-binding protein|nr:VapC toxin family domain ribonuclease [Rariglobus sp.]